MVKVNRKRFLVVHLPPGAKGHWMEGEAASCASRGEYRPGCVVGAMHVEQNAKSWMPWPFCKCLGII